MVGRANDRSMLLTEAQAAAFHTRGTHTKSSDSNSSNTTTASPSAPIKTLSSPVTSTSHRSSVVRTIPSEGDDRVASNRSTEMIHLPHHMLHEPAIDHMNEHEVSSSISLPTSHPVMVTTLTHTNATNNPYVVLTYPNISQNSSIDTSIIDCNHITPVLVPAFLENAS